MPQQLQHLVENQPNPLKSTTQQYLLLLCSCANCNRPFGFYLQNNWSSKLTNFGAPMHYLYKVKTFWWIWRPTSVNICRLFWNLVVRDLRTGAVLRTTQFVLKTGPIPFSSIRDHCVWARATRRGFKTTSKWLCSHPEWSLQFHLMTIQIYSGGNNNLNN